MASEIMGIVSMGRGNGIARGGSRVAVPVVARRVGIDVSLTRANGILAIPPAEGRILEHDDGG